MQGRNTHPMNYDKPFEIENSGSITIQRGCKIRATTVMNHLSVQTTKTLQHYTPHNNLSIFSLYKSTHRPTKKKYEINLTEATRELWISNHNNNIEATFEDIIQKARQIKERKFREQWITAYSATGCGGWNTRNPYDSYFLSLSNFLDPEYYESYLLRMLSQRKKERKKGRTREQPQENNSQENKNAKIETPDRQSALTSHIEHQDSVIITIASNTPIAKEDKSTQHHIKESG